MNIINYKPWSLLYDLQNEIDSMIANRHLKDHDHSTLS